MYKKVNVVMLPTNEKAGPISIGNNSGVAEYHLFQHKKDGIYTNHTFQHFYIIFDEEIKESEYGIDIRDNKIFNCNRVLSNHYEQGVLQFQKSYCKKIIATTNENLIINNCTPLAKLLPQPSQQFIQHYIEEYNKGNIITKVMVEYEKATYEKWLENGASPVFDTLKVNPDNTINIKPIKDSWTKNDTKLIKAFQDFACAVYDENYKSDMSFRKRAEIMSVKWIKENL